MDLDPVMDNIDTIISFGALVASIVAMFKSGKAEKLQAEVAELDAKLKALELADAEERRAARVEARLIKIGKNRKLRFCNAGKDVAKDVDFVVLNESVSGLVLRDHVPFPELEFQDSFDETLLVTCGIPSVFDVDVRWTDSEGERQSRVSHLSL